MSHNIHFYIRLPNKIGKRLAALENCISIPQIGYLIQEVCLQSKFT